MAARKKAHGPCRSHRSSWLWDCCNWLISGECLPKGRQIKSERHSHNLRFAVHAYKSYIWYRINQNYASVRKKLWGRTYFLVGPQPCTHRDRNAVHVNSTTARIRTQTSTILGKTDLSVISRVNLFGDIFRYVWNSAEKKLDSYNMKS